MGTTSTKLEFLYTSKKSEMVNFGFKMYYFYQNKLKIWNSLFIRKKNFNFSYTWYKPLFESYVVQVIVNDASDFVAVNS